IVVGLMLSTLIMSAAFGTGDTLTSSVTSEVYSILGQSDELIHWDTDKQVNPLATVAGWQQQFADDPDIEAFVPFLSEQLPVQDTRTHLNDASARIVAFKTEDADRLGGLEDKNGAAVRLTGHDIALNTELADDIDAR